jgi:thioredoxin:protein disulfide reductase
MHTRLPSRERTSGLLHRGRRAAGLGLIIYLGVAASMTALPSPIQITASLKPDATAPTVQLRFLVPAEHRIYAARLKFEAADGQALVPSRISDPVVTRDKVTGEEKPMYDQDFTAEIRLAMLPAQLWVKFQSCSNSACYFPEKRCFQVSELGASLVTDTAPSLKPTGVLAARQPWELEADRFQVVARETGYLKPAAFLAFLDQAEHGRSPAAPAVAPSAGMGLLVTLASVLLGGLGLNLTPCVLPLIPINLALIGAGARSGSRRRGFALGAVYGAGMALVYGVLGLGAVLTGSKFGTLNASPWFNAVIALVFAVLALGMFGFVNIDFTRFQGRGTTANAGARGRMFMAFGLGVMAALLAGACVAPVVISVLVLSAQLYNQGVTAGLLLLFVLGLGMALPWPFAGAGLSFLPKPGAWMVWVKYVFGVLILAFAAYYGHLAAHLFQARGRSTALTASAAGAGAPADLRNEALLRGLTEARQTERPVLIDFAASWCKNCVAMDETVFNQAVVQDRLKKFVVIRYEAEQPNESPARQVLDRFGAMGLPTYVVLKPASPLPGTSSSARRGESVDRPRVL